jgi:hypothetical protein
LELLFNFLHEESLLFLSKFVAWERGKRFRSESGHVRLFELFELIFECESIIDKHAVSFLLFCHVFEDLVFFDNGQFSYSLIGPEAEFFSIKVLEVDSNEPSYQNNGKEAKYAICKHNV